MLPGRRPEPRHGAADTCVPASREKGPLSYTAVFQRFVSPSSPRTVAFWCFVVCSSPERFLCLLRVVSGNLLHTSAPLLKPQHTTKPTVQLQLFPRPPTPWAFQDVTKQLRPLLCTGPLLLLSCFVHMLLLPLCCFLRYGLKVTAQLSASLSKTGCFQVEDRSPGTELRTPAFRQAEKKVRFLTLLSFNALFRQARHAQ